ncbi:MAG: hypothetical protein C5B59_00045 [Bacteroidetes bacterium]|nr:MAG: hypothetical protein C5B59_00045 [Bacteroidota bacterium]
MLKNFLNNYITRLKGDDYIIDDRVPGFYLINLVSDRVVMKVRGFFSGIKSANTAFIGKRVKIKVASKLRAGKNLSIGTNCYIDALSENGILLGDNVSIGRNTIIECTGNLKYLGKGLKVGNNVGLGSDNFFGCAGGIEIDDDTIVGNFVSFHAENHVFSNRHILVRLQGVTHLGIKIGKNCWIGAKATILDGAVVQDGCIIAAGAVLNQGVYESNGIYGGVPAKLIKNK